MTASLSGVAIAVAVCGCGDVSELDTSGDGGGDGTDGAVVAGSSGTTGGSSGGGGATAGVDLFGVHELNPTAPGGRTWYLPTDPTTNGPEWYAETKDITSAGDGVFHTSGNKGQVRLNVPSPDGKAWWRDVEMTGYFRYTGNELGGDQAPHWELFARGERHSSSPVDASKINFGVAAPPDTTSWPGYPFPTGPVNPRCLGSSYHGNFYLTGRTLFEKEITHTGGYAPQQMQTSIPFENPTNRWFGLKMVIRNHAKAGTGVHLETWVDADADGTWTKVISFDDTPGSWSVSKGASLDGCDAPPFNYARDMVLDWAAPWVTFRSDGMETEFRWLSVRDVGPVP